MSDYFRKIICYPPCLFPHALVSLGASANHFSEHMSLENEVETRPTGTTNTTPKDGRMYARIGDGHWYAILPGMESALRQLGAVVQTTEEDSEPLDVSE